MAGHVMKRRRLMNPGRRRRHMSDKQIRIFGTPRQKAALKARNRRRHNAGPYSRRKTKKFIQRYGQYAGETLRLAREIKRKRRGSHHPRRHNQGILSRTEHAAASAIRSVERAAGEAIDTLTGALHNRGRRQNVAEILTVVPAGNPGRRRRSSMYRTHNRRRNRRRHHSHMAMTNRRRHNRRRRTHNPRVIYRYHNRRHRGMHNRRRRHNPGFLTGNVGAIVGVLGGATVTKIITGMLPSTFTSGFMGYVAAGVTAVVSGQLAGRATRNRQFGNWVMVGGLLVLALEVIGQFFPTLQLPFGLTSGGSGIGLISSSNFYVPQVNMPGSMASFVTPAGITAALPVVPTSAGMHGIGGPQFAPGLRTMRRIGRMR